MVDVFLSDFFLYSLSSYLFVIIAKEFIEEESKL